VDFLNNYLHYTADSEVPIIFHRWSIITAVSAFLERNVHLEFGHTTLHPNHYCMLIGTAGTRKSTAIKLAKKIVVQAGFSHIAAERTSKEKFLADLSASQRAEDSDILEQNLFGTGNETDVTPMFIAADEANDFFGIGNLEFLSVLGSLWDWNGKYENKIKTGKSDWINNPTISILSGNTPTNFSLAFPASIIGQGFFSRLLLVYGEPNGNKIAFPRTPDVADTIEIVKQLQAIKSTAVGPVCFTPASKALAERIYETWRAPEDPRFESYSNRRLPHLLKLCMVLAAMAGTTLITERILIQANTYLTYIENLMPKALGEYGKAKDSDVTHQVVKFIEHIFETHTRGTSLKELWAAVATNLNKINDLSEILRNLSFAGKISVTQQGFFPIKKARLEVTNGTVAFEEFLSGEELKVKG
jgi:hypothetical protein